MQTIPSFPKPLHSGLLWLFGAVVLVVIVLFSLLSYPSELPVLPFNFLTADYTRLSLALFSKNDSTEAISCSCAETSDRVDDLELFQDALQVSKCAKLCKVQRAKLALLFLTRGALPLAPIWARFLKGHEDLYSIYIHPMPGQSKDTSRYPPPFREREIPSREVGWAALSELDAERRLLAHALLDPLNQRFMLVSESCIPIRSFPFIYSYLMSQERTFLNSFDEENWWAGRGRYVPQIFLPEITLEQWRKGAQWFTATREDATLIVGDVKYYRKYAAFCQAVPLCYPAEHYFPTLLYIEHGAGLANQTMTFVDWSQGGPHPRTFFPQDLAPEAIRFVQGLVDCPLTGRTLWQGVERPCWLNMRKIAAESLDHLLGLPPDVLGY